MTRFTYVLATLLLVAVEASAVPPKIVQRTVTTEELSAATNYWTPARMAAAIPRDIQVSGPVSEDTAAYKPGPRISAPGWDGQAQATDLALGSEILEDQLGVQPLQNTIYPHPFTRYFVPCTWRGLYPYKTVGKIFFTIPSGPAAGNYVCSGSVIRPHLILTARHCIYDWPSNTFAVNVVFHPGYCNGATNPALGGAWAARVLLTWGGAGASPEIGQWDIGFIQTFRKNGGQCAPDANHRQIDFYTGFLGYSFGGNFDEKHWDDFGYPQEAPFNGRNPVQCEAGTGKINAGGIPNTVEIGCDQTRGSSGGPWLTGFVPLVAGPVNFANSLNSFKFNNQPLAINGPQFQQANFKNLLDTAVGLPCPP